MSKRTGRLTPLDPSATVGPAAVSPVMANRALIREVLHDDDENRRPSLRKAYRAIAEAALATETSHRFVLPSDAKQSLRNLRRTSAPGMQEVGVIGAGMAGLRAAMLLQGLPDTNVTILEADSRIGAR